MSTTWIRGRVTAAMLVAWTFVAALFVATGSAQAVEAGGTLVATVGPDPTITLTQDGAPVTSLEAGTYTIEVDDKSENHNFHLTGPGVDETTTVPEVTTTTWTVDLAEGTYDFVCDPHAQNMKGSFTVTSAGGATGAAADDGAGAAAGSEDLPFTGLDMTEVAILGASLLSGGLALAFVAGGRRPKRDEA